ncbi:MAG: hypothetical protein JXN59_16885 [Anaerolineae bacterium]|nr:hypothetical protein [Anaerolineae bacterium]
MDAPELVINTFGGLEIHLRGQALAAFESRREAALVVYLALNPHAHDRLTLAEMLWPGRAPLLARGNLRRALSNLGGALPGAIVSSGQQVSLRAGLGLWADVYAFESGLSTGLYGESPAPEKVVALEAAVALYHGDFLHGFTIASDEFEDWARLERERLRLRVVEALDRLVEHHESAGSIPQALIFANRLLQIDNWREKSHRHIMRLLFRAGDRSTALAEYGRLTAILAEELGLPPDEETEALADQIKADRRIQAALAPRTNTLPARSTKFIGRHTELDTIMRLLRDDPDCRLLTLNGTGGAGKTFLALEAAHRLADDFQDGVFWMDLTAHKAREALVNSVATAVGLAFRPGASTEDQLIDYLRERTSLLVLDNFEHLIPVACPPLQYLLEAAPGLCVLITSRQPLGITWECVCEVDGLAVPPDATAEPLMAYDAIQLFMDRARRVKRDFRLGENAPEIVRICRLVEGMPLGIELAAGWLRVMTCAEIAANLVDLDSEQPSIPDRHRSLPALLDDTWKRLSPRDQRLMQMLAVFEGGFTREAATTVAGAPIAGLASLVSRSLLTFDHKSGRYDMHLITKQYARRQLAQDPALWELARWQHGNFACGLLEQLAAALDTPAMPPALAGVGADIDNIRAAWQHALDKKWLDLTARALDGLAAFYTIRNWNLEAMEMLGAAEAVISEQPETAELARLRLRIVLRMMGPLQHVEGYATPKNDALCHLAWDLCRRVEQTPDLLHVLYSLGEACVMRASYADALEIADQGLALAGEFAADADTQGQLILIHDVHTLAYMAMGRLEQSLQHARWMVEHYDPERHAPFARVVGFDIGVLGLVRQAYSLCLLGYLDQAMRCGQQALAQAEALNSVGSLAFLHAFLPLILFWRGDWQAGDAASEQLLALCEPGHLNFWLGTALVHRALFVSHFGQHEEAIALCESALSTWAASESEIALPHFLGCAAHVLLRAGRIQEAAEGAREGLEQVARVGERVMESDLLRLQGELLLASGDETAAERAYEQAITAAQAQHARYFELRAMICLARLWEAQGRGAAARARLAAITGWFTEGLDTLYLQEARALLDTLPAA